MSRLYTVNQKLPDWHGWLLRIQTDKATERLQALSLSTQICCCLIDEGLTAERLSEITRTVELTECNKAEHRLLKMDVMSALAAARRRQ